MEVEPPSQNILDKFKLPEIRGLVLASLSLQIILALSGRARQRCNSKIFWFILWSAYLLADMLATTALGLIAASKLPDLVALWTPFLLLHLGGSDTITALSLEDNNLWLRHFLKLVIHTGMAVFILIRSFFLHSSSRSPLSITLYILVFLAGFLKYLERTLSLMSASFSHRRYSDFMFPFNGSVGDYNESIPNVEQLGCFKIISDAHYLFKTFKGVFVNLSIDQQRIDLGKHLLLENRENIWKDVFKVIEIELLGFRIPYNELEHDMKVKD